MMFSFGSMTVLAGKPIYILETNSRLTSTVAVQNFSGMMALRWFLGMISDTLHANPNLTEIRNG